MFSGLQEILLIGLIIAGIIIVPRVLKPQSQSSPAPRRSAKDLKLTWPLRLAIVLSLLWPLCWVLYFKPWQQTAIVSFVAVGIVPVAIFWCTKWVVGGVKVKGRSVQKETAKTIGLREKDDA